MSDPVTTPTQPEPSLISTPTTTTPTEPASSPSLLDDPAPAPAPAAPAFGLAALDADKFKSLLPEGFAPDEALSAKFLEAVNGADSREAFASKMISLQAEMLQQSETAAIAAWDATQDAWKNEVTADPEFGGEKLNTSLATARTLIETHAKDQAEAKAIKEFMTLTGAGNSIHMVRLLNRLAARIPGEATPVEGTPAPTDKSRAEKLFGSPVT